MSKIVLLGDLHGNLPATLAMEKELERIRPDEIWFIGDAVGKGPESDKTCDWVRTHCDHYIGGNWDYWIAERECAENVFYYEQLGDERMNWLQGLPAETELLISGVHFRVFHGRPVTPLFQGFDDKDKLESYLTKDEKHYDGFICADSHRSYQRVLTNGYAINTGSVGNSLGVVRAHALLLEGEKDCVEAAPFSITNICVPYDNELSADIARHCPALPNAEAYIKEVLTGIYSR